MANSFATLTQKITGTTSPVSVNLLDPNKNLPKDVAELTRQIPSGGNSRQVSELVQSEVTLPQGQPSTTPSKDFNADFPSGPQDGYRNGSLAQIPDSRRLGEPEEEKIASISLSSDVALNTGSERGDVLSAYSRFFLQSVRESQNEKFQIVETFTAFYTFFYGKRPPVYSFQGTLLNDDNYKWTNDLMFFYENYLRGSRSAELNSQAILSYDGRMVSGFILNLNIQQTADIHKGAAFSIDVLVTEHLPVNFSVDINSLIEQSRAELQRKAEEINFQISTINRSIPASKSLTAAQALNSKARMSGAKNPKKTARVTPSKKGKNNPVG